MNERLNAVLHVLNQIEVHGEGNLDRLLACMQEIKAIMTENEKRKEGSDDGTV